MCNCNRARRDKSGGEPFYITEFTSNYETFYEYRNWDEICVYKCLDCDTIWYLKSSYTDRPPYYCTAVPMTMEEYLKRKEEIEKIN